MDDFRFPWEEELNSKGVNSGKESAGEGAAQDGAQGADIKSAAGEPSQEVSEERAEEPAEKYDQEPQESTAEWVPDSADTGFAGEKPDGPDADSDAGAATKNSSETAREIHEEASSAEEDSSLPDSSKGYFQQDDLGTRPTSGSGNGSGYKSSYDAYRFHDPEDTRGTYSSGNAQGSSGGSYGNSGRSYGNSGQSYGNGSQNYGSGGQTYGNGGQSYGNGGSGYRNSGQSYGNGGYNGGGTSYGNGGGNGGRPPRGGKKPKRNRNGNGGRKAGFAVLLAAVFAAVFALVFVGASMILRSTSSSSSETASAAESDAADSTESIVLGSHDSTDTSSAAESTESASGSADTGSESTAAAASGELTTQQVVQKVMPSMVAITNVTVSEYQNFFGESQTYENVSAGSGIIVGKTDDDLLIATNNHVISGSSDITVTFVDDSAIAGSIKGTDADNDLAIVAVALSDIPEETQDAISIVEIGDSDSLEVGESVVAIGNALGYGQSVSKGIVSALNREVEDTDGTQRELIQTDASINPGNSGGALLNMKGQLVGINEAKYVDESVEGVGYAIPMAVAEPILTKLGSNTARTKVSEDQASYIGISAQTMPSYYTQNGYPEGVYVAEVTAGGPAEAAGIQVGDIITSVDGTAVTTSDALINLLTYYAAGEEVEVSVSRMNSDKSGFEKKKFTVTLGSRADMPSQTESTSQRQDNGSAGSSQSSSGLPDAGDLYNYFFGGQEGGN